MIVEALLKPLRVNLPQDGGEVILRLGEPTDVPVHIAGKLLCQANGRVRLTISPKEDWLTLWRFVAEVSDGLEKTDPRLAEVLKAYEECDAAFSQGNKTAFLIGIARVLKAMEIPSNEVVGLF